MVKAKCMRCSSSAVTRKIVLNRGWDFYDRHHHRLNATAARLGMAGDQSEIGVGTPPDKPLSFATFRMPLGQSWTFCGPAVIAAAAVQMRLPTRQFPTGLAGIG